MKFRTYCCIADEEFILLYDVNGLAKPEFPYWTYPPFDLERFPDDECNTVFYVVNLGFLNTSCTAWLRHAVEALCVLWRKNSYPCRFSLVT